MRAQQEALQGVSFSLDAGAPSGAAIDAATGLFTWMPTAAQIGSHSMIVRVTDTAAPSASATRALNVTVADALRATIVQDGSQVSISFPTINGPTYRVEFKNTLDALTWTQLGSNAPGTGARLAFPDDLGASPHRFYRVIMAD